MHINAYGSTDVGRSRDHNEDFILVRDDLGLFLVCDGMGGHAGGEIASELAARTVEAHVEKQRRLLDTFDASDGARAKLVEILRLAVEDASKKVFERASSEAGKHGMGTTLTALVVARGMGFMAHVGDSRLYLLRDGELHQLSEDHSYVQEMIAQGIATPEKARQSPYANMLTRAVGIQSTVKADTLCFDILSNDTLLACSDGLVRYFESEEQERELGNLLASDNLEALARQLIDTANARGGKDNISVVLVRAESDDPAHDDQRTTEVNLRLDTLKYISLFRHLSMKELVKVLEVMRVEKWKPGEVVIREGETGHSLYVIVEGELEVSRGGKALAELQSGDHFGEMALLNAKPRSATVKALTKARLLVMDKSRFQELLQKEVSLGMKLLWTFAQVLSLRLDTANEPIEPPPFK